MRRSFLRDPGECIICGAAHCACSDGGGPITIAQLPARDELAARDARSSPASLETPPDPAPAEFSTKDYRGDPRKKRR